MIKLFHASDFHIRGLQYLDEIRFTFDKFFESVDKTIEEYPDDQFATVVTGDIFHSKLTVTNEYFSQALDIFIEMARRAPVVIIPGNHDLSLPNKDRLDAITPVVKALEGKTLFPITYSKKSERWCGQFRQHGKTITNQNFFFHHFSIIDPKYKWPTEKNYVKGAINAGLYHGSINDSEVDSGWTSRGNQDDISIFDGLEMCMLGDIHKCQFLRPTIAYPGSIRQNNFGESIDKGYILWSIDDNHKISGERVILEQKRYFITLFAGKVDDIVAIEDLPKDCRFRVKLTKEVDIVEEIKIKNRIEELYAPSGEIECILPEMLGKFDTRLDVGEEQDILQENIRNIEVQQRLIGKFFEHKELPDSDLEEIYALDRKYHTSIKTDLMRNVKWTIEEIEWDNLFSYGRANKIDLKTLSGITGILGSNGSGKTSVIDVLNLTLFNNITKEGANKNFDYINRKCKNSWSKIKISLNGEKYIIERGAKKYGKVEDEKVENSIEFYKFDKDGNKRMLNGETKPDTNNAIRDIFGTMDDFAVTSMCSQFGLAKFIDARATERKKTISKFFDLDIFEEKYCLALERAKDIKSQLKLFDVTKITKDIEENKKKLIELQTQEVEKLKLFDAWKLDLKRYSDTMLSLAKQIYQLEHKADKAALTKQKQQLNTKICNTLEELLKLDRHTHSVANLNIENEREKLYKLKTDKATLRHKKMALQETLKVADLLETIPNVEACKRCPLAEHAYDAQEQTPERKAVIRKLEEGLANFNEEEISNNIDSLQLLGKRTELEFSIKDTESKLSLIDESIKLSELDDEKLTHNQKIELELADVAVNKTISEQCIASLERELRDLQKQIGVTEATIVTLDARLAEAKSLSRQSYIYNLYLEAVGKDGVAFWIITKKIPIINNILNKILSQIFKMKIALENDEEEKTLKIYCFDECGKRPVELLSGAEKAVVSLAMRTAFWYISTLPKSSVLILDESFSFVETSRIDQVMKALSYLKNYFQNIIIITHDNELKGYCDHILYVNRVNGFSKISE